MAQESGEEPLDDSLVGPSLEPVDDGFGDASKHEASGECADRAADQETDQHTDCRHRHNEYHWR